MIAYVVTVRSIGAFIFASRESAERWVDAGGHVCKSDRVRDLFKQLSSIVEAEVMDPKSVETDLHPMVGRIS